MGQQPTATFDYPKFGWLATLAWLNLAPPCLAFGMLILKWDL
jgi:hypothetical protein